MSCPSQTDSKETVRLLRLRKPAHQVKSGARVLQSLAGLLRDSVVLSCASWCQLQRAPLGKLLKLHARFSKYRAHNAGVEGSSPSLSTNSISVLAIGQSTAESPQAHSKRSNSTPPDLHQEI